MGRRGRRGPLNVDPRPWTISVEGGIRPRWLINGATFDPAEVDRTAEIGEVVTWRLRNNTKIAHLMHLHHTDWYMLRRNGATPPAHERCLKETFLLDPFDEIVVAGKMSDYTGKYVVHCHMLDHEDHGLMSQFEVVEPRTRSRPATLELELVLEKGLGRAADPVVDGLRATVVGGGEPAHHGRAALLPERRAGRDQRVGVALAA